MAHGKQGKAEGSPVLAMLEMPMPEDYPTYHGGVARAHPGCEFEVLSRVETREGEVMEDVSITGPDLDAATLLSELRQATKVRTVELLESSPTSVVYRVTLDMTPVTRIFAELHLLMRYPVRFTGGTVSLLVVAAQPKVSRLYQLLREVAPDTILAAIRHESGSSPPGVLTPRQKEIFKLAMDAGYWDIPRRINLTDLATLARVSKSTMWESLATVEMKLLRELKQRNPGLA